MTIHELSDRLTARGSHFFDRKTMRFFGDTMGNFGVKETTITDASGAQVEVYEVFRCKAVKHGLRRSAYFDKETLRQVWGKEAS